MSLVIPVSLEDLDFIYPSHCFGIEVSEVLNIKFLVEFLPTISGSSLTRLNIKRRFLNDSSLLLTTLSLSPDCYCVLLFNHFIHDNILEVLNCIRENLNVLILNGRIKSSTLQVYRWS